MAALAASSVVTPRSSGRPAHGGRRCRTGAAPPGRPRRFDARFYLAEAGDLYGAADDFARASGELLYLNWLDIDAARKLALPFITEVVLSELEAIFAAPDAVRPIPFFDHGDDGSHFRLLTP